MADPKIAPPSVTGQEGADFERNVDAYYLALILLQARPMGLDEGRTKEVRLQRRFDGQPLDDLIVVSEHPDGDAFLSLQIKLDLNFNSSDRALDEVIRDAWKTYSLPTFRPRVDRFGVVLGRYSNMIDEHCQKVLNWARHSASSGDFLRRLHQEGLSHRRDRDFADLIRKKIDGHASNAVADHEYWSFLKCMVIIHLDLLRPHSQVAAHTIELLKGVLRDGYAHRAADLFERLKDIAAIGMRSAGSYDIRRLSEIVLEMGFPTNVSTVDLSIRRRFRATKEIANRLFSSLFRVESRCGSPALEAANVLDISLRFKHGVIPRVSEPTRAYYCGCSHATIEIKILGGTPKNEPSRNLPLDAEEFDFGYSERETTFSVRHVRNRILSGQGRILYEVDCDEHISPVVSIIPHQYAYDPELSGSKRCFADALMMKLHGRIFKHPPDDDSSDQPERRHA
jgi:hypothetical protein